MSEPKWLNEEEIAFWRAFLARSTDVLTMIEAALRADTGIWLDDYEVLVHLSAADDHRMRMGELSETLIHSRSRLTQRVDRLAARGLVAREPCPDDRRGTFAVLTPEGFAAIEAAAPDHVRAVREFLIDRLSPEEIRRGTEILERLRRDG